MYEKQFSKFNESETSLKRLLQNPEFTAKIRLEEQKPETMTTLQKFQALWDDRDADYFERIQTRKESGLQEYCIIQKAIQREKIKTTLVN